MVGTCVGKLLGSLVGTYVGVAVGLRVGAHVVCGTGDLVGETCVTTGEGVPFCAAHTPSIPGRVPSPTKVSLSFFDLDVYLHVVMKSLRVALHVEEQLAGILSM